MITIEMQATGGQIGHELRNDLKKMAYALEEMADNPSDGSGDKIACHISIQDTESIAKLLRSMLTALDT